MTDKAPRCVALGVLLATLASIVVMATPAAAEDPDGPMDSPRRDVPEDRYAMAGGCYVAQASSGGTASAPLQLEATDLGRYLLVLPDGSYVSSADGSVAPSAAPSPAAEWDAVEAGEGRFTFRDVATGSPLAVADDGGLRSGGADSVVALHLADGCFAFPDIDTGVSGPYATGSSNIEEVKGYLDDHLHITAFEFLGGRAHCGRPWSPYGVAFALVDCPDHQIANGSAAVLENLTSNGSPIGTHDPVGWPTFHDWPAPRSLTHEQTYYRWLERAWRGGVRMIVNLFTDNRVLCDLYPLKQNSCDEMASARLQAQRIHELERYIDAQHGGPGEGWMRIVGTPDEARAVINQGKLAVVLGIELSEPFGCSERLGVPQCTAADIDAQLDSLQALGVRQVFAVHKLDNALGGTTGDGGVTGNMVNFGNLLGTGSFWDLETCDPQDTGVHDSDQSLPAVGDSPALDLLGAVVSASGAGGALPVYPPPHHCNTRGLTDLGRYALRAMMARGMVIDVDHMDVRTRNAALDEIGAAGYSGVISSHSWATPDAYPRILAMGGVVNPYAGDSKGFVQAWEKWREMSAGPFLKGIGWGADSNGLGGQGGPRGGDNPVTYPFSGFGGTTIDRQVSGSRTFDINVDGVAHYGLYPDWVEDLRQQAGDAIVADLERGPEAYLEMWERANGIAPTSCLTADTLARLHPGMTASEVLVAAGQPSRRVGHTFTYCDQTLSFDAADQLEAVPVAGVVAGASAPAGDLPATGGTVPTVAVALLLAAWLTLRRLLRGPAHPNWRQQTAL